MNEKESIIHSLEQMRLDWDMILQLKSQSVYNERETLYWVNTRELNGVPVTKCLPYIYLANGPCYTNLAYPKETCVLHTINI